MFNSLDHLIARAPEILGSHYEIAYPARQLKTARNIRQLPLHAEFEKAQAFPGQFYGWERPLYFNAIKPPRLTFEKPDWFENVRDEVMSAHFGAAVFDLSSFGKIDVIGPDAEAFLLASCAGYLGRDPGSVIYSAVLNAKGTFESDLTAQRITKDHYRLFVGTNAIKKDMAWFNRAASSGINRKGFNVAITDVTEQYAAVALMGPDSTAIAGLLNAQLDTLRYFKHTETSIAGIKVRAARISYVGEFGWEFSCKTSQIQALYKALTAAGAKPAGLFAQTSMRIEKGFRAMGHELDSDVTPVDVGLQAFTRKAGGFTGFDSLSKRTDQPLSQQIVSLKFNDELAVPLGHEPVMHNGSIVGKTTSCTFGYRVNRPIALAQVSATLEPDLQLEIDIAGKYYSAEVSIRSLYDPDGTRMKSTTAER